jgi:magnesium transporter
MRKLAEHAPDAIKETPPVQAEGLLGLSPDAVDAVITALAKGDEAALDEALGALHPAELANLIELIDGEHRRLLIGHLGPRFDPAILPELDDTVREEIVDQLGTDTIAEAIAALESDDALLLIETLSEVRQRQVLAAIPAVLRAHLEEGLAFPEDSAGRLMQRDFVAVPAFWTVGETIDYMRENDNLPNDFYEIFVVDPRHRPIGTVTLSRLLRTKRPVPMAEIIQPDLLTVPAAMDQEEVAYIFAQHDLVSAPVVDHSGRLIGAIMVDDVVDVIHEEAEEDLMRLGGVREDDLYEAVIDTGRARFSWLLINLVTAIVASAVISLFEDTIQRLVMLAVLMPIVASMGGNAGTQTLTVVVRAIAMKELTRSNAARVLTKEVLVGLFNGVLFAVLIGVIAWIWSGDIAIGLVIAAAMIITLVIAGLAGAAIPFGLSVTGIDPAIASGVFLTTVTDVVAFLTFLGLATWFLL